MQICINWLWSWCFVPSSQNLYFVLKYNKNSYQLFQAFQIKLECINLLKNATLYAEEFNTLGKILDVTLSLFYTALCKYNAAKYTFASRHEARVSVQTAAMQNV